ncbi:hypothetical protein BCR42DRAFT_417211 [Absidia repens]|uniref:Uncharacterized protein n=1 Tax=Absidia repens TaxID=90262 RepID=A0A1X2IDK7_9FUNG|nr:hypothetical protein BCR42DRAFT_417211 [Absidia repens]
MTHTSPSNLGYPDAGISGAYYTPAPAPASSYYDPHQQQQAYPSPNNGAYMNMAPAPAPAAPTYSAPNAYDDQDAQKQRYH